ncbi:MAG: hypothetical protein COA58_03320 [Bacteroidetes bacterium]|nr:MAG: hypothetical protein COA58_03320 [Bacteroidota bacterium]
MPELNKFDRTKELLIGQGYQIIDGEGGYKLIKGVDFTIAFNEGNISFRRDGIYLEYNGKTYKGFVHLKKAWISRYNSFPSAHLVECEKIDEFKAARTFENRYEFANSSLVNVKDMSTPEVYNDLNLVCCSYCTNILRQEIQDTTTFHDLLDKDDVEEAIEVDISGYKKGQEKLSRAYRKAKDYTCENCRVKSKNRMDNRYWHMHHVNGDKTYNVEGNIKCLCILCHSTVDMRHIQNFSSASNQREIRDFKNKYN